MSHSRRHVRARTRARPRSPSPADHGLPRRPIGGVLSALRRSTGPRSFGRLGSPHRRRDVCRDRPNAETGAETRTCARDEIEQIRFGARLAQRQQRFAGGCMLRPQIQPYLPVVPIAEDDVGTEDDEIRAEVLANPGQRATFEAVDVSQGKIGPYTVNVSPGTVRSEPSAASSVAIISENAVESQAASDRCVTFLNPSTATERRTATAAGSLSEAFRRAVRTRSSRPRLPEGALPRRSIPPRAGKSRQAQQPPLM